MDAVVFIPVSCYCCITLKGALLTGNAFIKKQKQNKTGRKRKKEMERE
jgi:hypothetical protein